MAAEVLGGRVHHDVGAELQRPREHGRGERVVDAEQRAAVVGDFGAGGDVGDRHQRIAGRFDPHELRGGRHRGRDVGRVGRVDDA